ncbi:MAG TPA: endo-1,4-beta-xylanase, partial [Actinomycetota bacterium]|nr:endo-1,4-beta-xylanase [Actinomycetota bacterium]
MARSPFVDEALTRRWLANLSRPERLADGDMRALLRAHARDAAGPPFEAGDAIVEKAKENRQLIFGAHLVWDEGLGEGWEEGELFELSEQEARQMLFAEPGGTLVETVKRYANEDHVVGWIVVNEIVANGNEGERGMRTDYPWYQTIGREFVAESFHLARKYDPNATLVLNEFGFET